MKLHSRSVVQLHDLYHRKEGERYILGDPETGEFLVLSAAELRVVQLFQSGLTIGHVRELVKDEQDAVEVEHVLHALARKHLIHRVDGRTVHPRAEPHVSFAVPSKLFGNPAVAFLLGLVAVLGAGLIVWSGSIPGPGAFLYQESVVLALLAGVAIAYAYAFIRQLAKHGQAAALGLPAQFGLRNKYGLPFPATHVPPATEAQQRKIVGKGLLTLLALTLGAGGVSVFYPNGFATFVFLIGILELLAECFLFLETDLARYIGYSSNVHQLHEQTKQALKEDARSLGKASKETHTTITSYSFLFLASYVVALLTLGVYYVPIAVDVIGTALGRMIAFHPLAADGVLAAILLTFALFWYGFATLRHHPLAHNTLFVNLSLLAIVAASFLAAVLVASWARTGEPVLGVTILFALGLALAALFRRAVLLAHPFTELHGLFESVVLPILAACLPLGVLFLLQGGVILYVYSAMLALGMLSALVLHDLQRTISWQRKHATR